MKPNWKWPAHPGNNLAPWYAIAWRLLWVIPYYLLVFMLVAVTFAGWGKWDAMDAWDDLR